MATKQPQPERSKRLRLPDALPKPPVKGGFAWSPERAGLEGLTPADHAIILSKTEAWAELVRPLMEQLDQESIDNPGKTRAYSAEQLELVFLYGRAHGLYAPQAIREKLGGDGEAEARQKLGFTREVAHVAHRKGLKELPSKDTLYRHKNRVGEARRHEMILAVEASLRDEALKWPEMQEAARILYIDASALPTRFSAPKYKKRRKGQKGPTKLINPPVYDKKTGKRIRGYTAPDAGNRGGDPLTGHEPGDGWQLLPALAVNGLPLTWVCPKIHHGESTEAEKMLRTTFAIEVKPKLKWNEGDLGVATADSLYHARGVRLSLQELGYVPNSHSMSHKDSPGSKARAETARRKRLPIHDHLNRVKNWYADGHRQLHCNCGEGHTYRRVEADKQGRAVTRVEGSCKNCGPITITAGQWRNAQNPSKKVTKEKSWFVPVSAEERRLLDELRAEGRDGREIDWQFGNPLTFDDPVSRAYGEDRFGHQEGFFGVLATRFGVGRGKSRHRTNQAQEIEVSQTFCLMYALALTHWKHVANGANVTQLRPDPPPIELERAA